MCPPVYGYVLSTEQKLAGSNPWSAVLGWLWGIRRAACGVWPGGRPRSRRPATRGSTGGPQREAARVVDSARPGGSRVLAVAAVALVVVAVVGLILDGPKAAYYPAVTVILCGPNIYLQTRYPQTMKRWSGRCVIDTTALTVLAGRRRTCPCLHCLHCLHSSIA